MSRTMEPVSATDLSVCSPAPEVRAVSAAPQRCIACDRPPRRSFRLRNGAWLLCCPRCGLGWWDWPAFDPAVFYDRDYFQSTETAKGYNDYQSLEAGVRRTARARLRRIEKVLLQPPRAGSHVDLENAHEKSAVQSEPRPSGSGLEQQAGGFSRNPLPDGRGSDQKANSDALSQRRLLELGCGTGLFLDEARRAGWRAEGIEVSMYGVEQARRRGLAVECGPVEGREFGPAAYDCVALWDVIEHLRDPAGVLRAAGRALRPGGVLALSTGDLTSLCARLSGPRWHLFNLPEHLFFFSPRSLRELLAQAGCRTQAVTREINWVPAAYLWERLQKSWRGATAAATAPQPAAQPAPRAWVVPATLFDVLGVYAVKTV